jgi:hypothetical protein
VVCLLLGGVVLPRQTAEGSGQPDEGSVPSGHIVRVEPAGFAASERFPAVDLPVAGLTPVRLRFPRLDIDARVRPVSVSVDGLLDVPDNPRQLGWWSSSGKPGMPSGSAVIAGHVDSATLGLGALFRLREARPGDEVLLTNAAGVSIRHTVVARRRYAKTSLPLGEVFAQDVGPRLVLVTCGGQFNQATHHYADNVVVYAVPK